MSYRARLAYAISAVAAAVLFGMAGYVLLEGWSWFDGLYMTIITLATIGYGETHALSPLGRAFTLVLIGVGVVVFGYLVTTLTQGLIETEIASVFGRRKLFKDISQLKEHYVLCGAGRMGLRIISEMERKGVDFVIIERDEAVAERLLTKGHLVLIGDATDEAVLKGAQIASAKALVAAASNDAENVYIVLTARGLNPKLHIVARAVELSAERQLIRAGANKVVSPVLIGSHRMAQAALAPAVADFIELTTMTETLDLNFEQIRIGEGSPLDGKALKDSGIRAEHNAMIVAIVPKSVATALATVSDEHQGMLFNPPADHVLQAGDMLIAIGTRSGLEALSTIARQKAAKS